MIAGALIAVICNIHVFAGSDVSMFDLSKAYAMTDAAEADALIKTVATNEFMRGLSFIPLIATTAVTTGVYGVAGFTFIYVAGYLSPNPIIRCCHHFCGSHAFRPDREIPWQISVYA